MVQCICKLLYSLCVCLIAILCSLTALWGTRFYFYAVFNPKNMNVCERMTLEAPESFKIVVFSLFIVAPFH